MDPQQPPGRRGAPDRLLTPQEAADLLHVSRSTLLRWAREGRVTSVTVPSGRRRFRLRDLPGFDTRVRDPGPGHLGAGSGAVGAWDARRDREFPAGTDGAKSGHDNLSLRRLGQRDDTGLTGHEQR